MITNYYFIVGDSGLSKYIKYKNLRLILFGDINKINNNGELIDIVKVTWDYWDLNDIR